MTKLIFKATVLFIILLTSSCNSEKKEKQHKESTIPFYTEPTFSPIWAKPNSKELENLHRIPSFSLINQDGEIITEKTFENKIYITDFFFTSCPGICPKMTKNMNVLQETFKDDEDILLLSHSVTPEKDSVSTLKDYAKLHGVISGKWHLVTGNKKEIYNLGRKSYFVEEDLGLTKSSDEFIHTENFVLVDKNKHIRGIYNGLNKKSIQQLVVDIKTLKREK
jgi:protein SCO1